MFFSLCYADVKDRFANKHHFHHPQVFFLFSLLLLLLSPPPLLNAEQQKDEEIVYPRIFRSSQTRGGDGKAVHKRDLQENEDDSSSSRKAPVYELSFRRHEDSDLVLLELELNKRISGELLEVHWEGGVETDDESSSSSGDCFLVGRDKNSLAALNVCEGQGKIFGYVEVNRTGFTLEPVDGDDGGPDLGEGDPQPHTLRRVQIVPFDVRRGDEDRRRNKRDITAEGWDGYFVGDLWDFGRRKRKRKQSDDATKEREAEKKAGKKSKRGEIVCNGPYCEYFR